MVFINIKETMKSKLFTFFRKAWLDHEMRETHWAIQLLEERLLYFLQSSKCLPKHSGSGLCWRQIVPPAKGNHHWPTRISSFWQSPLPPPPLALSQIVFFLLFSRQNQDKSYFFSWLVYAKNRCKENTFLIGKVCINFMFCHPFSWL